MIPAMPFFGVSVWFFFEDQYEKKIIIEFYYDRISIWCIRRKSDFTSNCFLIKPIWREMTHLTLRGQRGIE